MKYHYPLCDLYLAGASPEIYRLNLERGQFLSPFISSCSDINKIEINPIHNFVIFGTKEGKVEAWDPRNKTPIGTLDCAFNCITENRL